MIVAIDPGPKQSAYVLYDPRTGVERWADVPNDWLRGFLRGYSCVAGDTLAIEMIASYGMPVGAEVFDTCVWIGRFIEAWRPDVNRWDTLKRASVKAHLCGTAKAKDSNVRQALIDRFGGPSCIRKGGELYKLSGDCWQALAVAVVWADLHQTPG